MLSVWIVKTAILCSDCSVLGFFLFVFRPLICHFEESYLKLLQKGWKYTKKLLGAGHFIRVLSKVFQSVSDSGPSSLSCVHQILQLTAGAVGKLLQAKRIILQLGYKRLMQVWTACSQGIILSQRETETDRHRQRDRDRKTERQRQTEERETETETERDRKTETETER